MIIIPAIDILDGKPVRLYKGDYNKKEIVAEDVVTTASKFESIGAKYIHLVDLDGAKVGRLVNSTVILNVVNSVKIPVEVGGGIRNISDIEYLINNGVSRVILGTAAIEDKKLLKDAIDKFADKIAVGIDCKNGLVYGRGWLEASDIHYISFAKELEKEGVKTIIVTDISKDGTLEGVNIEMLRELQKNVKINIIASGGIKDSSDICLLKNLDIYGAITGKAIYANTLSLNTAISISEGDDICILRE